MVKDRKTLLIILFLVVGVVYRLLLTSGGNFIFHMDNARDMVDVREMVELKKLRLIGPTSGIEGLYNGPAWYYLMAIPFIISGGDPYSMIIMEILFWVVGGFFLLKLASRWGVMVMVTAGSIWVASDLLVLNTINSLSPNPVILLGPVFIYYLERYLLTNELRYSLLIWFLAGLFFQFEMAAGVFAPLIILLSVWISGKREYFRSIRLWLGVVIFALTLAPQIVFDLRYQFIMSKSVLRHLGEGGSSFSLDILLRIKSLINLYRAVIGGLLMNLSWLLVVALACIATVTVLIIKKRVKERLLLILCLITLATPFVGYLILPMRSMPWHAQAMMSTVLIIIAAVVGWLTGRGGKMKMVGVILMAAVVLSSAQDVVEGLSDLDRLVGGSANFKNEITAIDYVYQQAQGKNFKTYIFLPSVIDYPYQYLIWWYGQGKYGYLPKDYAYLPDKPPYISNKERLVSKANPDDSPLVFLIKEPDQTGERHLWENSFNHLPLLKTQTLGPIIVETRIEVKR